MITHDELTRAAEDQQYVEKIRTAITGLDEADALVVLTIALAEHAAQCMKNWGHHQPSETQDFVNHINNMIGGLIDFFALFPANWRDDRPPGDG